MQVQEQAANRQSLTNERKYVVIRFLRWVAAELHSAASAKPGTGGVKLLPRTDNRQEERLANLLTVLPETAQGA